MTIDVPVIAVVGPVEPELLDAFIAHYRNLGVQRFLLAVHLPEDTPDHQATDLLKSCQRLIGGPAIIERGPWHEHTNGRLRDQLREQAGSGWHLIADIDEFQHHPVPLAETITAAENAGHGAVGGLMLDRVSADGRLTDWELGVGLDTAYPLGGFLTPRLLLGDPRKIVLAHSDITIASGNHRAPGNRPGNDPPIVVHHFKWRRDVIGYLRQRESKLQRGEWQELSPAARHEAGRLLDHVADHGGRIGVGDPRWGFRQVTVAETPEWWAAESRQVLEQWRPPGS